MMVQADLDGELVRLLGSERAEPVRWLLGRLAGANDPMPVQEVAERIGPIYRQPERFLTRVEFWGKRLGAYTATGLRADGDGTLEASLRDAKGRDWTFRCAVGAVAPHRIEFWTVRRAFPPGLQVRRATERDAAAIAAIERACPIERDDGSRLTLVRGTSLFEQAAMADHCGIWLAEQDSQAVACDARAVHEARVGGRRVALAYRFHTRVAPSHRRLGLNESLPAVIVEREIGRAPIPDGLYVYVDPRNQAIRDWSPSPPWRVRPLRALLGCEAVAGGANGRAATPTDAPRIGQLLDAAHAREELYVPHDAARVEARLGRLPGRYGWGQVWIDGDAVVGVWEDREERILERDGQREKSLRATVLDWGFDPQKPGGLRGLEGLLRAWCARLAQRGITHLSIFTSHASPALPLLNALAESVVEIEFQCTLPEPRDSGERGVYVDPVYY